MNSATGTSLKHRKYKDDIFVLLFDSLWKVEEIFDMHCNENPIYVFPEKEFRGLSPNFHIHVSVSDL